MEWSPPADQDTNGPGPGRRLPHRRAGSAHRLLDLSPLMPWPLPTTSPTSAPASPAATARPCGAASMPWRRRRRSATSCRRSSRRAARLAEGPDRRQFFRLMAASFAMAGLAACSAEGGNPRNHEVPYVRNPERIEPSATAGLRVGDAARRHRQRRHRHDLRRPAAEGRGQRRPSLEPRRLGHLRPGLDPRPLRPAALADGALPQPHLLLGGVPRRHGGPLRGAPGRRRAGAARC